MTHNALTFDDKQARRESIITAARILFLADTSSLPSVSQIAVESGLGKGTVYLYFRTKEEIFMALLHQEWGGLLEQAHLAFQTGRGNVQNKIDTFLGGYAKYIKAHPELLQLDSLGYSILERNLDFDCLRDFKVAFARAMKGAGETVDASLGLAKGQGLRALLHTYSLTRGLWQSLNYPDTWRKMMADPQLSPLRLKFQTELSEALRRYWIGVISARQ